MMRKILVFLMLSTVTTTTSALEQATQDISVSVSYANKQVILDAKFTVNADVDMVWDVVTDFDHAANFISNLQESRILEFKDNAYKVEQKGFAKYGLLSFGFESIREIQLTPKSYIQTHLLSGTMQKFDGSMTIKAKGDVTEVIYHSESIPGVWIPPLIGKHFIQHETQEQFSEIRQEVMRRKDSQKSS